MLNVLMKDPLSTSKSLCLNTKLNPSKKRNKKKTSQNNNKGSMSLIILIHIQHLSIKQMNGPWKILNRDS